MRRSEIAARANTAMSRSEIATRLLRSLGWCLQQGRECRARPSRPLGETRPAVCKLAPPGLLFTREESALAGEGATRLTPPATCLMILLLEAKSRRRPMELFAKLFDSLLIFVYHCFDRIVIHGYLSGLSRPEQVVYFFRQVLGVPVVDKELLSRRTNDYQAWVEAYARNHRLPFEWADK